MTFTKQICNVYFYQKIIKSSIEVFNEFDILALSFRRQTVVK